MNIYEQQFLCPTNFPNGINVGNFSVEDQLSPGLPAGLVQPYLVTPTLAGSEFLSGQIAGNATMFIPLSEVKDTENNNYVIVNGQLQNPGLKLDCERGFTILLRKNGSVLVSGYDRYEQKMTWGSNLVAENGVPITRAFSKISSIQFTNSEGTPSDFTITSNYDIGLPYDTLPGIIPLVVNMESTNDFINILLYQSAAPGNQIYKLYTWHPSEAQTLSAGRQRPVISVNPGDLDIFYDFDGSKVLSVWQLVYGAGTLPHYMNDRTDYVTKVNSLETVIGVPPYSEGWIGWQG
jgi:hypothetical protein